MAWLLHKFLLFFSLFQAEAQAEYLAYAQKQFLEVYLDLDCDFEFDHVYRSSQI